MLDLLSRRHSQGASIGFVIYSICINIQDHVKFYSDISRPCKSFRIGVCNCLSLAISS